MGGTYALVVDVPRAIDLTVGALGDHTLPAGGYAYVGSAFGPGGLSRVDRHRRIAAGEHDARHWHVDYLLGHEAVGVDGVVAVAGEDAECAVARELGSGPVPGFGAADCDCEAHLFRRDSVEGMRRAVEAAFTAARGE